MTARRASRDAPSAGSASGRVLLVGAAVFALAATGALVLADQQKWLKLGIIAALWAALVGAFLAAKYRRQLTDQEDAAADRQEIYELELEREVAARREYELEVVADAKRQAEESARDDLAALRQEMSTLRQTLESLLGGEFLVERYALRAESTRMRALHENNPLPARNNLKRLPAAQPKDDEVVPPVVREAETDLIERVREVHHARRDPPVPHPPQRAERPETRRPAARAERKVEPRQSPQRMEAMAESWPAQRVEARPAQPALDESWPAQRVEARQSPPQPARRVDSLQSPPPPAQRMEAAAESWPARRVEARQSPPQPARQVDSLQSPPSPAQRVEESWPAQRVESRQRPSPARRAEPTPKPVDPQPDPGAGQWVELEPEPQPQKWVELEQESWPAARMERESRPAQQPDRQQERPPRRAAPDPPTRRVAPAAREPQPASAEFPVPRKQPWVPEPHPTEVSDRWFIPGALQTNASAGRSVDDEWAPSWESGRQNGHDPDVPFGHQAEQTTWLAQYNNPQPTTPAEPNYSSRAYVQRHRAEPEPEVPVAGRRHARAEPAESGGGGRRRRAEGQPPWQESMAFRDSGSHARPEPAEEPSGSHAAGRSVNELLASHGVESSPRRRRRRED